MTLPCAPCAAFKLMCKSQTSWEQKNPVWAVTGEKKQNCNLSLTAQLRKDFPLHCFTTAQLHPYVKYRRKEQLASRDFAVLFTPNAVVSSMFPGCILRQISRLEKDFCCIWWDWLKQFCPLKAENPIEQLQSLGRPTKKGFKIPVDFFSLDCCGNQSWAPEYLPP